jgi:hypothetical protein
VLSLFERSQPVILVDAWLEPSRIREVMQFGAERLAQANPLVSSHSLSAPDVLTLGRVL